MTTFPEHNTRRCVMRRVTPDDIPALRQIIDDELFLRFLPELYKMVRTNDGLQRFIRIFDTYVQNDDGVLWGITTGGSFVGFIAVMDLSYDPVLFYAVHPKYRNQGIAKESVAAVLDYCRRCFPGLDLHTEIYEDNQASIRLLEDCGFRNIGKKGNKILLFLQELMPFAATIWYNK